jgi:hypothetical protein
MVRTAMSGGALCMRVGERSEVLFVYISQTNETSIITLSTLYYTQLTTVRPFNSNPIPTPSP